MINYRFCLSILLLTCLFACKEQQPAEESTETEITEKTIPTEPQKTIAYSFDAFSALGYKVGDPTYENLYPNQVTLKEDVNTYAEEGETWDEPKTVVSDKDGVLVDLVHAQDHRMGNYVEFVEEIMVHSPKLKNRQGIGVGSTIQEFEKAYPFSKIYYTYISETTWLEIGIPGYQFYIDTPKDIHKKVNINSDLMELSKHLFDANTPIRYVRIQFTEDEVSPSQWQGKDANGNQIDVKIYKKDGKGFADIKTGEGVYQQFTEPIISKEWKYFSLPTSNRQIRIETKRDYATFYFNDNPEFAPIEAMLYLVEDKAKPKELAQNISSNCQVIDFSIEGGRMFVNVKLIDMIENNENGFDIVEGDNRTFELVEEQFLNCKGQALTLEEIKMIWEGIDRAENNFFIEIKNGYVTQFYLENCAG